MTRVLLIAAVALTGCTDLFGLSDPGSLEGPGGEYSVQLYNDGATVLRNVRVTTGQDVPPLTKAELAPGELTAVAGVPVLHEHPIVTATVDGRTATYQPIEGFTGFNAQLPRGRYVIRLRYVEQYRIVETRVETAP